jgi:hypothetical protein
MGDDFCPWQCEDLSACHSSVLLHMMCLNSDELKSHREFFAERSISWCINVMPASSTIVTIFNGLHYFAKNDPPACGSCEPSCYTFTRTTSFDDDYNSGDDDYYNHYYYGDKVNYYKHLTARTSQTQRQ